MAFVHKPGSFSLFKNDKGENASRPDYRGEGKDLAGNEIEVACWLKDGGKGKFMSCSIKMKGDRQQAQPKPTTQPTQERPARPASDKRLPGGFDEMTDDVPF